MCRPQNTFWTETNPSRLVGLMDRDKEDRNRTSTALLTQGLELSWAKIDLWKGLIYYIYSKRISMLSLYKTFIFYHLL